MVCVADFLFRLVRGLLISQIYVYIYFILYILYIYYHTNQFQMNTEYSVLYIINTL